MDEKHGRESLTVIPASLGLSLKIKCHSDRSEEAPRIITHHLSVILSHLWGLPFLSACLEFLMVQGEFAKIIDNLKENYAF